KTVDKLAKQFLITRTEQEMDRRSTMLSLTKLGERMIMNYNGNKSRRQEVFQKNYSREEMEKFEEFIDRYINTSIEYHDGLELVCMQCDGNFSEKCTFKEISESCYYKVNKTEKKQKINEMYSTSLGDKNGRKTSE
ncbi:MAG: hypothetical protein KAI81_01380, partial [Candidatus Marinimicrobia bacterium]|nr:hypothetical protein [Candidatus Neomarinimicrobiota bacterium]